MVWMPRGVVFMRQGVNMRTNCQEAMLEAMSPRSKRRMLWPRWRAERAASRPRGPPPRMAMDLGIWVSLAARGMSKNKQGVLQHTTSKWWCAEAHPTCGPSIDCGLLTRLFLFGGRGGRGCSLRWGSGGRFAAAGCALGARSGGCGGRGGCAGGGGAGGAGGSGIFLLSLAADFHLAVADLGQAEDGLGIVPLFFFLEALEALGAGQDVAMPDECVGAFQASV